MRRFSVYKRGKYYQAQLRNPDTGERITARSTGKTDRDEALIVVADWLRDGFPDKSLRQAFDSDTCLHLLRTADFAPGDIPKLIDAMVSRGFIESAVIGGDGEDTEPLIAFLTRMWDYENSPYIREKLNYGQAATRRHANDQTTRITRWKKFFGDDFRLRDLTRQKLEEFQMHLKAEGLKPRSINNVTDVGTPLFSWAAARGIIREDPTVGLRKFSFKPEKRGVLTPDEIKQVFTEGNWYDERARVGNLIAATCGLRQGEVLALQIRDVQGDRLNIEHSFSRDDDLKGTKTNESRQVPLLPSVRSEIMKLIEANPWGPDPGNFIHYGPRSADRPMSPNILRRGLQRVLDDLKIDREGRKIVFHSWRHAYAARLADRVELRRVQLATGHKTGAMAEHYAAHALAEDFSIVSNAVGDAFGEILNTKEDADRREG